MTDTVTNLLFFELIREALANTLYVNTETLQYPANILYYRTGRVMIMSGRREGRTGPGSGSLNPSVGVAEPSRLASHELCEERIGREQTPNFVPSFEFGNLGPIWVLVRAKAPRAVRSKPKNIGEEKCKSHCALRKDCLRSIHVSFRSARLTRSVWS